MTTTKSGRREGFKSITIELPIGLIKGVKRLAKQEQKSMTQKVRELVEQELNK